MFGKAEEINIVSTWILQYRDAAVLAHRIEYYLSWHWVAAWSVSVTAILDSAYVKNDCRKVWHHDISYLLICGVENLTHEEDKEMKCHSINEGKCPGCRVSHHHTALNHPQYIKNGEYHMHLIHIYAYTTYVVPILHDCNMLACMHGHMRTCTHTYVKQLTILRVIFSCSLRFS